jgi:N-formylglutamate amidohydrolase
MSDIDHPRTSPHRRMTGGRPYNGSAAGHVLGRRRALGLIGQAALLGAAGRWLAGSVARAEPDTLVTALPGGLPILLTAPHGGSDAIPGVPPRLMGSVLQDARTDEITEGLADRLASLLGARPYTVMARFHRRYVDANRPPDEALESPEARPYYDAYHAAVRRFVDEIRDRYQDAAILLDVHGQAQAPDTVFRGTRDGLTVAGMLARRGVEALIGPKSILGRLGEGGYTVFPPNTPPGDPSEDARYFGGYTVTTYGSHNPDGIDAVQVELGSTLRMDGRREQVADDLAQAIAVFYHEYLAAGAGARSAGRGWASAGMLSTPSRAA